MLRKIKLYGHLREHTGLKEVEAYVDNVRDAVNFLTCNWPKLESKIVQNNYHVLLDEDDVGEEELLHPIGDASISFIPVVEGSGKFGKIIAGFALIGGAFLFTPLSMGSFFSPIVAPGSFAAAMPLTKAAVALGGALVLSGIADLFTPAVEPEAEDPLSANFSNAINTTLATVPIPILYGECITGSVVISAGIDTADGSPSTPASANVVDHRGNTTSVPEDPDTGQSAEEYDRDNSETSLRRYVRIYSASSTQVKIEAVVGDNTYQGTGYTNTGDELLTAYREQNKTQFNYSAFVLNGNTKYFPGNLKESIGTFDANNRPSTGANDGYYYGLVTGTT